MFSFFQKKFVTLHQVFIDDMANLNERAELHKTIWKIANDLRGSVDGWEFKAYVLGSIFYRFISENICDYIHHLMKEAGQPDFDYANISDEMAENIRQKMVEEKGYFILPSQLFQNVIKTADKDENLNERLTNIFRSIEASAIGTPSEDDLRGLFSDFTVDSQSLGSTVIKRNQLLAKVLGAVSQMELGAKYNDTNNDTFGDTYEFLMQMYASQAGKSGGEFFTPQQVSELLARLASWNNPNINKVYDPACGSGSLLLKFAKTIGKENPNLKYFGQEVNPTTYNLCRINMFLHNVNYDNFDIRLEDTLLKPQHMDDAPFDAIVSNPPYSLKWDGKDNPILINDERYAPAGVLAPKSAADLAFTMHMLWHLSERGTAAIVEFPGVLYRGGDEKRIRQYLIQNNFVDTVIQLPANLFFGVGIATCIIVLKRSAKADASVLFIDASKLFQKDGNKNVLLPEHQDKIMELFQNRKDEQYLAKLVKNDDILANDANLSVSSYVEQEDTREVINISEVNAKLEALVAEGNELNEKIEAIIKELGE
jgi:type I restriction enzyme M protein